MNYAIVLAAGASKRMNSNVSKCAMPILGKPMLLYALDALYKTSIDKVTCIVGYKRESLYNFLKDKKIDIKIQHNQLGTLDAIKAVDELDDEGYTVVVFADNPLLEGIVIEEMINIHINNVNDITKSQGLYVFNNKIINNYNNIHSISDESNILEIDDLIDNLEGYKVGSYVLDDTYLCDINTMYDLVNVENVIRKRIIDKYLQAGIRIDYSSTIGPDVLIEENTVIHNSIILGNSIVHKNIYIKNSDINDSVVFSNSSVVHSVICDSIIGESCEIGPFSHIRNNSMISGNNRVGNYVEIKNSKIGEFSKLSHHAYMGDTMCGENVNFGCGAITVNYDGKNKHKTQIGDNTFIGCNCNLIAPIKIDSNCYIAAGSTITNDINAGDFAIARAFQIIKEDYAKKYK